MDREWNLIFGVLAAQLAKVDCSRLAEEAAAWVDDPSRDLPERLRAAGALTEDDARLITALVDLSVKMHGNDSVAALAAFGGDEQVRRAFYGGAALGGHEPDSGNAVTKVVSGKTLGEKLREAATLQERMHFLPHLVHFTEIIAVAHARGAIHRALHPGNLLITDFNEDVVLDWSACKERGRSDAQWNEIQAALASLKAPGASRAQGEHSSSSFPRKRESSGLDERHALENLDSHVRGNDDNENLDSRVRGNDGVELDAAYVAPEIVLGHAEKVDASSDVYALGGILYLVLTGQPPFTGTSAAEVLANVTTDRPAPPATIEADAPVELTLICERAMQKEPSARYATARQLLQELKNYQQRSASPSAAAAHPGAQADAGTSAGSRALLAGVAALALVAFGACYYAYHSASQERAYAVAARDLEVKKRAEAETAAQKLIDQLADAKLARAAAEAERDRQDAALAQAQEELKQGGRTPSAKPHENLQPRTAAAKPGPKLPALAALLGAKPKLPAPPPPATAVPAGASVPLPEIPMSAGQKSPAPAPPENTDAAAEPVVRAAGLTRAELVAALPDVLTSLKLEKVGNAQAVVVHVPESKQNSGARKIGFHDGDVITRINRSNIESVDQAGRALANIKTEPGFSIRVIRDGQSGWMRVNFSDAAPQPKPEAKPSPPPKEPAPELAPAPENTEDESKMPPPGPPPAADDEKTPPPTDQPPAMDQTPATDQPAPEPPTENNPE